MGGEGVSGLLLDIHVWLFWSLLEPERIWADVAAELEDESSDLQHARQRVAVSRPLRDRPGQGGVDTLPAAPSSAGISAGGIQTTTALVASRDLKHAPVTAAGRGASLTPAANHSGRQVLGCGLGVDGNATPLAASHPHRLALLILLTRPETIWVPLILCSYKNKFIIRIFFFFEFF